MDLVIDEHFETETVTATLAVVRGGRAAARALAHTLDAKCYTVAAVGADTVAVPHRVHVMASDDGAHNVAGFLERSRGVVDFVVTDDPRTYDLALGRVGPGGHVRLCVVDPKASPGPPDAPCTP